MRIDILVDAGPPKGPKKKSRLVECAREWAEDIENGFGRGVVPKARVVLGRLKKIPERTAEQQTAYEILQRVIKEEE